MPQYEKKTGKIDAKKIDLTKIYDTAANAAKGLHAVTITDHNQSWKSDKLTYQTLENGTVMILNEGVPIGFTTSDILENDKGKNIDNTRAKTNIDVDEIEYEQNEEIKEEPAEEAVEETVSEGNETIDVNVENVTEEIKEETPTEEPVREINITIEAEDPKVQEEDHNGVIASGEEAPVEKLEIDAEVDEKPGDEVEADEQQPPENEINIEIEAEVDDTPAEEIKEEDEEPKGTVPAEETIEMDSEVEDEAAEEVIETVEETPATYHKKENGFSQIEAKEYNDAVRSSLTSDYSNHNCGVQARTILANMGIVAKGKKFGENAYQMTENMTEKNFINGYTSVIHEVNASNQAQVLDQIIEDNNGRTGPLVISFTQGGHYGHPAGHIFVITSISDGKIYGVDTLDENWNKGTTTVEYTIDEFKAHYFSTGSMGPNTDITSANRIVEIK